MEVRTEENQWQLGAQSWKKWLGQNYAEHSAAPQACERHQGDPTGLSHLVPFQVAHISPVYGAYPNLDEEMIARNPIINARSKLKLNEETKEKAYVDHQWIQ